MNNFFSDFIKWDKNQRHRVPAVCVITVNKQKLALSTHIPEVTVHLKRNVSGTATLVIITNQDERGRWLVQDSDLLRPWCEVQISAKFGRSLQNIIHGYVREVRQDYPNDMSAAGVTVVVQDDLLKLEREQIHGVLSHEGENKSDGEIARELAKKVGMECITEQDVNKQELSLTPGALRVNSKAIKILRERAEANGYELYTRDAKLYFHSPQLSAAMQPTIMVYAGPDSNCINFNLQYDGRRLDLVRLMCEAEVEKYAQTKADENQFKIKATGELDMMRIKIEL